MVNTKNTLIKSIGNFYKDHGSKGSPKKSSANSLRIPNVKKSQRPTAATNAETADNTQAQKVGEKTAESGKKS